ncbi:MAG: glycosyltransferase, partial [Clostridiales bacterium]|nr:glycosyltransferase [Clostridiales bacterium]
MSPTVSIILPAYNTGKYICKCIESIQNQTFGDWELIIVDDGSTD